jgi:hypothetical protein
MKPTSDCFVDRSQMRFVITRDPQLELRHKFEEVLSHEPGRYPIAAGQCLNLRLGPASSFLRFSDGNKTRTAQACEVGWMALL